MALSVGLPNKSSEEFTLSKSIKHHFSSTVRSAQIHCLAEHSMKYGGEQEIDIMATSARRLLALCLMQEALQPWAFGDFFLNFLLCSHPT
jgi:hypothetical protein